MFDSMKHRIRPRLPEPSQVYALGYFEQMVIAIALQHAADQPIEGNTYLGVSWEGPHSAREVARQMLSIFGTAGTVTVIKHQDQP